MELFWIKELIGESHKISLSGKHGADLNKTTLFFEDNCFASNEMRLALRFTLGITVNRLRGIVFLNNFGTKLEIQPI